MSLFWFDPGVKKKKATKLTIVNLMYSQRPPKMLLIQVPQSIRNFAASNSYWFKDHHSDVLLSELIWNLCSLFWLFTADLFSLAIIRRIYLESIFERVQGLRKNSSELGEGSNFP